MGELFNSRVMVYNWYPLYKMSYRDLEYSSEFDFQFRSYSLIPEKKFGVLVNSDTDYLEGSNCLTEDFLVYL